MYVAQSVRWFDKRTPTKYTLDADATHFNTHTHTHSKNVYTATRTLMLFTLLPLEGHYPVLGYTTDRAMTIIVIIITN